MEEKRNVHTSQATYIRPLSTQERVNSAGRGKPMSRTNGRSEKAPGGERLDNRPDRQAGEDRSSARPPRGQGVRQRLGSKDEDRVSGPLVLLLYSDSG